MGGGYISRHMSTLFVYLSIMSNNQVSEPLVAYIKSNLSGGKEYDRFFSQSDITFFQDMLLMSELSEAGIPYRLFSGIEQVSPLSMEEWADILGLSTKTLTRYNKENKVFQPWHSAIILQITEVLTIGLDVFGDLRKLRNWLSEDNFALGGRSPLSLLTNNYGREIVLRELYAIEHGIFA